MIQNEACNLSQCVSIRRNRRNRDMENKQSYSSQDSRCIVREQLLDKIHCYFYHSFDTGHKLTEKEKQRILETETKTNDDNKEDINHTLKSISDLQKEKKKKLESEIPETKSSETGNRFTVNVDDNQYSFGYRYFYWSWYKHNHLTNDLALRGESGGNYNFAANKNYKLSDWYIDKKYSNLEDELLNNEIQGIDLEQYQQLYIFVLFKSATDKARKMKCVRYNSNLYYEIPEGQTIQIHHLLIMKLYTDYDVCSSLYIYIHSLSFM